jgi:hypothetical protein
VRLLRRLASTSTPRQRPFLLLFTGRTISMLVAGSTAVMLFGGVRQLVDAPTVAVEPPQRRALAA